MSNTISNFLKQYPLLISYSKKGLVNLNALARFIKEHSSQLETSISDGAISMELRRYLQKLPKALEAPIDFEKYSLHLIARSNIQEAILTKNSQNRKICLEIIHEISQTNHFVSVIEGEKEMAIMTDYRIKELINQKGLKNQVQDFTSRLSFVSINFPIELRNLPGVYSIVTSSLAETNISIHSFHTIGGEILILVKDEDLSKTQEILHTLLTKKD